MSNTNNIYGIEKIDLDIYDADDVIKNRFLFKMYIR